MKIETDRESVYLAAGIATMIAAPIALVIIAATYTSVWTIAAAVVGCGIVALLMMVTQVEWSYDGDED